MRFEFEPERIVGVGVRVFKTDAEPVDASSSEDCEPARRAPA